jgi:hypothetical protein
MINRDYEQKVPYKDYVTGKRIAIIGPASYSLSLNIGSMIDSYDLVVRVGRSLEVLKQHPVSLGKKANILYNSFIRKPDQGGNPTLDLFTEHNIEWLCTAPWDGYGHGHPNPDYCNSTKQILLHPLIDQSFLETALRSLSFHIMSRESASKINKILSSRANAGFAAIFDLLSYDIKELFICGYSFYLDPYINGYKKGCTATEADHTTRITRKKSIQGNHWQCLKDEVNKNTKVVVDPFLRKILNMESYSLEEFQKLNNV